VLGSPLSNEYGLIAEHFHLNEGQIRELARSGIDRIFGGEEQKKRLRDLMKVEGFEVKG
jgi:adenosine deaminase